MGVVEEVKEPMHTPWLRENSEGCILYELH
jgi:hypothetical protein